MKTFRTISVLSLGAGLVVGASLFGQASSASGNSNANSSPSPAPARPITPPPSQAEPPEARAGGVSAPPSSLHGPVPHDAAAGADADTASRRGPAATPPVLPDESLARGARTGSTPASATTFTTLDLDNDGRLSRSEFIGSITEPSDPSHASQPHGGAQLPSTNTNTETEFAMLDADKDGYLSQAEMASAQSRARR